MGILSAVCYHTHRSLYIEDKSMAKPQTQFVQRLYLILTLLTTLAASFIWGVNTLFLLSAGLSNSQAFLVNAFFTVGQLTFEIPTGIIADMKGRRTSFLLGTITLAVSTLFYLGAWEMRAAIWVWALASIMLGLGFACFSGATEAWLVDALDFTNAGSQLEKTMARAQVVNGGAMLVGSVSGGFIAQVTNLGVPYIIRAMLLFTTFIVAWIWMKDWGFEPEKQTNLVSDTKKIFQTSIEHGWNVPTLRWLMLAGPIATGIGFYSFYAMQPYLLELYGDPSAYGIAGLAAAIVAGAQIIGGLSVPYFKKLFSHRTTLLLNGTAAISLMLVVAGFAHNFAVAIVALIIWGLTFSAMQPVRQMLFNSLIPSKKRATVLSFDAMFGSSGGVIIQPSLGKVADVWSYGTSFMAAGIISLAAAPFIILAKQQHAPEDKI